MRCHCAAFNLRLQPFAPCAFRSGRPATWSGVWQGYRPGAALVCVLKGCCTRGGAKGVSLVPGWLGMLGHSPIHEWSNGGAEPHLSSHFEALFSRPWPCMHTQATPWGYTCRAPCRMHMLPCRPVLLRCPQAAARRSGSACRPRPCHRRLCRFARLLLLRCARRGCRGDDRRRQPLQEQPAAAGGPPIQVGSPRRLQGHAAVA
jgi:hypothetical protein